MFDVTDDQFDSVVLNSELPVLLDCWSPTCKPCIGMHPVLEALAGELSGRVAVGKINVDDNMQTAKTYGVRGLPMLMLFHNGEVVDKKLGVMSAGQITQWLEAKLGSTLNG